LKQHRQLHNKNNNNNITDGFIGHLMHKIFTCPILRRQFPTLRTAKFVEMWAHNRPHATGHQLHFDSDNEGKNGIIRNPIISTILYLNHHHHHHHQEETVTTFPVGGPSLITNQRLSSTNLAKTKGWLAYAKPRRMVAFDGTVLHGVIPGKGFVLNDDGPRRRVTLMLAFWKDIQIRPGSTPGAARPWPASNNHKNIHGNNKNSHKDAIPSWATALTKIMPSTSTSSSPYRMSDPIALGHVYEHLDGSPLKIHKGDDMPEYEQVFQGF
jgi:hypothetical protein